METTTYDQAATWAQELCGTVNFLQFWFPENQFVSAIREGNSISATRLDGDGYYGMSLGVSAPLDPRWNHFSISRDSDLGRIDRSQYKEEGEWEAYVISTAEFKNTAPLENLMDMSLVADFLSAHFPDSSVKAGDPEVMTWTGLRDDAGNLVGIGALSKWESGNLAAQSIAIAESERGKGYGKQLVTGMVATAQHLGYDKLCLGVYFYNESAKKLYRSVGFTKVDSFMHFSENQ